MQFYMKFYARYNLPIIIFYKYIIIIIITLLLIKLFF